MDYGSVLSRAAQIAFKHPWLWALGFFAALGTGMSASFSPNFDLSTQSADEAIEVLVRQLTFTVPFVLVFGLLGLLAQGSLIAGVRQIDDADAPSLGHALQVGGARFLRLLSLSLLLLLPIVLVAAAVLIVSFPTVRLFMEAASGVEPERLNSALGGLALICGIACLATPYVLFATGVQTLGERAVVLEDHNVVAALRRGAQLLFEKFLPVVILALILFVVNVAANLFASLVIGVPVGIVAGVVVGSGSADLATSFEFVFALSVVATLVRSALFAPLFAYVSAVWTLAYGELVRPAAEAPATPAPYTPMGL